MPIVNDEPAEVADGERCQRCGKVGEDRRTLWMACLYQMDELGLPFKELRLADAFLSRKIGDHSIPAFPQLRINDWEPTPQDGKRDWWPFYTLRVCKRCRGDWMAAIRRWFNEQPVTEDSEGGDIPIRELGAVRCITQKEWDERQRAKIQGDEDEHRGDEKREPESDADGNDVPF